MNISEFTVIKKGAILPEDFSTPDGMDINREKYIIESGIYKDDYWRSEEHSESITLEIIGAVVIGSKAWNDFRFRKRLETDKPYDPTKSTFAKIIQSVL